MAIINVRVDEGLKKRLKSLSRREGRTLSEIVRDLLGEKLAIEAEVEEEGVGMPDWVPKGRYVAFVRGAVASVGDSVSKVASEALSKFRDEHVQVRLKGASIRRLEYAFFGQQELHCWRYMTVDDRAYPAVPAAVIGKREVERVAVPDTAASVTMVREDLVAEAGLEYIRGETIHTPAGPVMKRLFRADVELPIWTYKVSVAPVSIPDDLPFQLLLGRDVLDVLDMYLLGKKGVVCIKNP